MLRRIERRTVNLHQPRSGRILGCLCSDQQGFEMISNDHEVKMSLRLLGQAVPLL